MHMFLFHAKNSRVYLLHLFRLLYLSMKVRHVEVLITLRFTTIENSVSNYIRRSTKRLYETLNLISAKSQDVSTWRAPIFKQSKQGIEHRYDHVQSYTCDYVYSFSKIDIKSCCLCLLLLWRKINIAAPRVSIVASTIVNTMTYVKLDLSRQWADISSNSYYY